MPKVVLVSNTEWYLYNYRLALGEFLRDRGFSVLWVSPPGPYADKLQQRGFRWLPWNLGRQTVAPWREMGALAQITRIYRREAPDLVHHNTIKPAIYGSLAARWAGVPGVINSITGRGYVFLDRDVRARLLKPLAHHLYRFAFRAASCLAIFENSTDRAYFLENGLIPPQRAHLIESSGVDAEVFAASPEPEGPLVIALVSRMLWDKGVGVLAEATRLLRSKKTLPRDFRVVLVGEPDEGNPAAIPPDRLRAWEREGLLEWWGFRGDVAEVFRQSHIVTLPTMYAEGLPISLLEAAASQRPLVGTTLPGSQDFIEDGVNGLLVPPGDPAALAAALEKLALDPELRGRMGAAGRKRVLEKYTHQKINTATFDLYQQLLTG